MKLLAVLVFLLGIACIGWGCFLFLIHEPAVQGIITAGAVLTSGGMISLAILKASGTNDPKPE